MPRRPRSSSARTGITVRCPRSASTWNSPKLLDGPNRHDGKTRPRSFAWMDRKNYRGIRHRHRASGDGFAGDVVSGDRRTEEWRRRTLDHALVPGAAGVSDVAAQPGRPPDAGRIPA